MERLKLKSVFKNIRLFLGLICVFWLIKIVACALPMEPINNNINASIPEFERAWLYPMEPLVSSNDDWEKDSYGQIDFFTELILLNSANTITGGSAVKDSMENPYSSVKNAIEYNPLDNLKASVLKNADVIEAPQYWWGLAAIYRILLSVFKYNQVLLIYKVGFYLLLFWCFKRIYEKLGTGVAMTFVFALLMGNFSVVTYSPNMGITFLISFTGILTIFSLLNKKNDIIAIMILIGSFTAFLDWMTTPILTFQMTACVAYIYMTKKEMLKTFSEYIGSLFKAALSWAMAYGGTLFAKWILSAIVTKKNILFLVETRIEAGLSNDINEQFENNLAYVFSTIQRNASNLLVNKFDVVGMGGILFLLLLLVIVYIVIARLRKNITNSQFYMSIVLILISFASIAWYVVFKGHTYIHFWFTYRNLVGMIMCVLSAYMVVWGEKRKINVKPRGWKLIINLF